MPKQNTQRTQSYKRSTGKAPNILPDNMRSTTDETEYTRVCKQYIYKNSADAVKNLLDFGRLQLIIPFTISRYEDSYLGLFMSSFFALLFIYLRNSTAPIKNIGLNRQKIGFLASMFVLHYICILNYHDILRASITVSFHIYMQEILATGFYISIFAYLQAMQRNIDKDIDADSWLIFLKYVTVVIGSALYGYYLFIYKNLVVYEIFLRLFLIAITTFQFDAVITYYCEIREKRWYDFVIVSILNIMVLISFLFTSGQFLTNIMSNMVEAGLFDESKCFQCESCMKALYYVSYVYRNQE